MRTTLLTDFEGNDFYNDAIKVVLNGPNGSLPTKEYIVNRSLQTSLQNNKSDKDHKKRNKAATKITENSCSTHQDQKYRKSTNEKVTCIPQHDDTRTKTNPCIARETL